VEIVIVRHGEPEWSRDGRSVSDPGLTARGRKQAAAVARRLGEEGMFDELLVSPALRCTETAGPVATELGLEPVVVDDLTEIRTAIVDGMPTVDVERMFREARTRPPDEWWDGLLGGESFHEFHDRVTGALDVLLATRGVTRRPQDGLWDDTGTGPRMVVVAHGGTNAVIITHLLGLEPTPWEWERFVSNHASVGRLALVRLSSAHVFALRGANAIGHLTPADRTW
jgi:2,3-bisphosphoglycerate-dependent phosphoglycerate mutase